MHTNCTNHQNKALRSREAKKKLEEEESAFKKNVHWFCLPETLHEAPLKSWSSNSKSMITITSHLFFHRDSAIVPAEVWVGILQSIIYLENMNDLMYMLPSLTSATLSCHHYVAIIHSLICTNYFVFFQSLQWVKTIPIKCSHTQPRA